MYDVTAAWNDKLRPGAIITDEPGLYIDEWEIELIEDDILIQRRMRGSFRESDA